MLTITKGPAPGSWILCATRGGVQISRTYSNVPRREAIRLFLEVISSL
jgi:hypothetical protein